MAQSRGPMPEPEEGEGKFKFWRHIDFVTTGSAPVFNPWGPYARVTMATPAKRAATEPLVRPDVAAYLADWFAKE